MSRNQAQSKKSETNAAARDDEDWMEVLETPYNLKRKASVPGSQNAPVDEEALARAEAALEELSTNFVDWMQAEIAALIEAAERARKASDEETADALYHAAHNVKGQAHTLGFPLAGLAGASLCRLIEEMPDKSRLPHVLVDNHVQAIAAIVRENVRDMENATACTLIDKLQDVSEDFLARERKKTAQQAG